MEALFAVEHAVAAVAERPLPEGVARAADAAAARFGTAAASVLFYGSCLRDGTPDGILDFYVLVDGYRAAYRRLGPALANAVLPPNVFYQEVPHERGTLRAKVAVMSIADFADAVGPGAFMPSTWARFCQPAVVAWSRNAAEAYRARLLLAQAVVTAAGQGALLAPASMVAADLWTALFAATYASELRAEGSSRPAGVVAAWPAFYEAATEPALCAAGVLFSKVGERFILAVAETTRARARRAWVIRRVLGKLLNLARLTKGLYTFAGGVDYVLWKIERHTGVKPDVTPWQRRHPLLALPWVAWKLYRQGLLR